MNAQVSQEALRNAGVDWNQVGIVVCGSDPWTGIDGMLAGGRLASKLGNNGIPVVNIYTACATGGYALKTAQSYINSGFIDEAPNIPLGEILAATTRAISQKPELI